jgi:voltage-gated potassium channel
LLAALKIGRVATILKDNPDFVVPAILVILIIFVGGFGVYLVEHNQPGANITRLVDAFWWAVVTITTVGYGDYYPVTAVGRIIAIFVMFSGIGIVVSVLGSLSQRRLQKAEARFRKRMEVQPRLGDNMKITIKNKIEMIDTITDEDFDKLLVMVKGLRRTLLEESKTSYRCTRCANFYYSKPKYCSNCGLDLS